MRHTIKGRRTYQASAALLALGMALAGGITQAAAQQAQPGQPQPDTARKDDEIIVTAEKTSQAANKVPQALSVFKGAQLASMGVTNVSNLSTIAPGLEIGSASHGVAITIRGVTTTDVTSKGDQDIVFSVDGIPIGRPQMMGLAFFDLDRVEVLRGPQGTLYGRSSTGGAINVITAKPTHELEASVTGELGNYNTRRVTAMVNLPVTSNFALRGAFNANKRDGFLTPTLGTPTALPNTETNRGDEDNWTARISGKLDISTIGSLVVTGTFGHIGGAGDANDAVYNRVINSSGAGRFNIYYNPMVGGGGVNDNFTNVNAELNLDLGAVHVAYDGAHIWFHARDNFDPQTGDPNDTTGTPVYTWNQYEGHLTTDSHEVRLSNANPGRLEWLVGANYWIEHNDESDLNWETYVSCAPSLSAACNVTNPQIVGVTRHKSEGVFGQLNFHVTDRLKLTGGLRYSSDQMSRNAVIAVGGNCAPPNQCLNTGSVSDDTGANTSHKVTWRVGAQYQITDHTMAYGSVSTGYKAGGFNDVDPTNPGHTGKYASEAVTAYELGLKGKIGATISYDTDVYYYDYASYQITGATFLAGNLTGGAPSVVIYTTTAPATLYGWESDVKWAPTPRDSFGLSFTVARGFYNNGPNAATVGFIFSNRVYWGGKDLDHLPGEAATLSYEHRFDLNSGGNIKFRVNSKISDGYYESDLAGTGNPFTGVYTSPPKQYWQPAYTRTDLNLAYTTASGKLTLEGYVRNIENQVQIQSAPTTPQTSTYPDGQMVRINLPRTYGVRLTVKY